MDGPAECGLAPGAGKTLDFEKYTVFYEVFVPKFEHTFRPLVETQFHTVFHLCHSFGVNTPCGAKPLGGF